MRKFFIVGAVALLCVFLFGCNNRTTTNTQDLVSVTFETNGGTAVSNVTVIKGSALTTPSVSKEGYSLDGWYISYNNGDTFDEKWLFSTAKVEENITLYAKWNINQYTIIFEVDDGTEVNPITLDFGSSVNAPTLEDRVGYTFSGWYRDDDYQTPYVFSSVEAQNITLYGRWEANQHSITYNLFEENYETVTQKVLNPNETIVDLSLSFSSGIITSEGRVMTWGFNGYGQLGTGNANIYYTPNDITANFDLYEGESIVKIKMWLYNSAFLSSTGRIFVSGYNDQYGVLGDGTTTIRYVPTDITSRFDLDEGEFITDIEVGWYCFSAMTNEGRVFTWGKNAYGQLGNGSQGISPITDITDNFSLESSEKVIKISFGEFHTVFLTSEGRTFTSGANSYGQLGDGTFTSRYSPIDVTSNFNLTSGDKIISVSSGSRTNFALSSQGNLYAWGYNYNGELGNGIVGYNVNYPINITEYFNLGLGEKINAVFTGESHNSVITSLGRIFSWGNNYDGQLGDQTSTNRTLPVDITNHFAFMPNEKAIRMDLGYAHSAIITTENRFFIWGRSAYGELGLENPSSTGCPSILYFYKSYVLTTTNILYDEEIDFETPTMEGYTFSGWYKDIYFTSPVDFTEMPDENITVYGKWEEKILSNELKDYYVVGEFNGWGIGINENYQMEAISMFDDRVYSIRNQLSGAEYLYLLEVTFLETEAGWQIIYTIEGVQYVFDGNLAFKVVRTNANNPSSVDYWAQSTESGEVDNLTPNSLYIPTYAETVDDGSGTWDDNEVALVAGTYYVIFVEFEDSIAIALIQSLAP